MNIGLSYATFKDLFRRNALLLYIASGGNIAAVSPLSGDDVVTRYDFTGTPPTTAVFTVDFPRAVIVTSIN